MPRHLSPILLVLCLTIAGSPLCATPGSLNGVRRAPVPAQATTSDLLSRLRHHLTVLWGAEGCSGDPDGARCAPSPTPRIGLTAAAPAPEGCSGDPNGLCNH